MTRRTVHGKHPSKDCQVVRFDTESGDHEQEWFGSTLEKDLEEYQDIIRTEQRVLRTEQREQITEEVDVVEMGSVWSHSCAPGTHL